MREFSLALDPRVPVGQPRLIALVKRLGGAAQSQPEVCRTLQRLGTEAGRGVLGDRIWVDTAMRHFTNCRFPNEADVIRDAGGQVVRVMRPGFPDDGTVAELHALADQVAADL